MNAATHYPMLAAQAEASLVAAAPCSTVEAQRGREVFLENLTAGHDKPLPIGYNCRSYKVSTFLGECSREAQAVLFAACHAVMAGRAPEEAAAKLATFSHMVAREFGEDSADAWCDV